MHDTVTTITQVEARLQARGWDQRKIAATMSRLAGIDPHTWRRWRNGFCEPNMRSWRKIVAELANIEGGMDGISVAKRRRKGTKKARKNGTVRKRDQ